ncbi:MAG: exodeoxyribonuclease III [Eubacteriales bacterium]
MKFISWNVNGLRACVKKGFLEFLAQESPDFLCLQETKMQAEQADFVIPEEYQIFWNSAEKKGYSGTAILVKEKPLSVAYGMGQEEHDHEGRLITLEYPDFYLVCCYTPNAQGELKRLPYRMSWEDALREYLLNLDKDKPVIYCGDLNVAHQEIDLKNPKTNHFNPGFSDQEREKISTLLDNGFVDSFRHLYPEQEGAYSWWSYRAGARAKNTGWRIDYFLISQRLVPELKEAAIYAEVLGSDHCPVTLELF